MDLSRAFGFIPHDLIIAELQAYGFDENALVLVYSYLKERKQSVRINNTYPSFQTVYQVCLRVQFWVPFCSTSTLMIYFYSSDNQLYITMLEEEA